MNVLKSRYSDMESLHRLIPNLSLNEREYFRGIYLMNKMTKIQDIQWKKIINHHQQISNNNSIFLSQLLIQCYNKNRSNILLTNIDMKIFKYHLSYEDYLRKNSLLTHICLSNIWIKRRMILSDQAFIYLFSEFIIIECLSRKRKLFIQLSGTYETFYNLSYYLMRTNKEKQRTNIRWNQINRRKRTIQFHLHATKQGQQAHLTDLYENFIQRHLMNYHVSKYEQFDIHHSIEKNFNGEMIVDTMISSEFSKIFFIHRPKQEVEQIRDNLIPIFNRFRLNHHQFYLRRRSRLPFSYTHHHVPEPTATLDQLISLTTPIIIVQKFLRIWLTKVLPIELFGSKYNHNLFIRKMCFLIQLPRTQQYSLGDAMRSIKSKHCQWTNIPLISSSLIQQIYFTHLIYFLIHYVLVLIRSYYYVTEASSPSHPLVLVFYRHKIWHVIQQKSRRELIEKSCSSTVEREFILDYENICYLWKIRFVPKIISVRYLACAQEQLNTKDNLIHLKYTNEILKYLRRHNGHLMGIATFNRAEMHRRWQDYCRRAPSIDRQNMIYFLRSDVSNFYDSINLDYLDNALVEFLDKCNFNYNLYIHTISKTQYRNGRFIRKKTIFWIGKENEQLCDIMADDTKHTSNGIFHDMIIHDDHIEIYNKEKLLKYIRAQLFNSYLYTRHHPTSPIKTYRRTIGINHGLRMASILGQIYLNKIDYDIGFTPLDDEFAVRHEDDLLIISPHRYRLRRIKMNMTKKLNELHHLNNPLKTKTNIRRTNMLKIRPVEYWGSLVDIQSREILVSINPLETIENKIKHLSIKITRETGLHLRHSLLHALCLRAHSYYFDRLYTTEKSLIKNFYFLTWYFLKRLHSMIFRFVQFYSVKYIRSKSLFIFRTFRSGLKILLKKTFFSNPKSMKLIHQCKYVFFYSCIRLVKQNSHLFQNDIIIRRFSHMIKKLKYVNVRRKFLLKQLMTIR